MKDIFSLVKGSKVAKARPPAVRTVAHDPGAVRVVADSPFANSWRTVGTHLIKNVRQNAQFDAKVRVAAFDLDGTLIKTKSGGSFARGHGDWQLWRGEGQKHSKVIEKLRQLVDQQYLVVIFTNQGGVVASGASKSFENFKTRVNLVVGHIQKDIEHFSPVVFASPKKPAKAKADESLYTQMRKPQVGMWQQLEQYVDAEIDLAGSFFVGDAAGRSSDFSDSDRRFAENVGVAFHVPEEFFA